MTTVFALIFGVGVIGLTLGVLMTVVKLFHEQRALVAWVKAVLLPWMVNISNIINPGKK